MVRLVVIPVLFAALLAAAPSRAQQSGDLYGEPIAEQDWTGFYAGVMGSLISKGGDSFAALGPVVGVNAGFDFVVAGAEVGVIGYNDGGDFNLQAQFLVRGGALLSDEILVYGAGGVGAELGAGSESFGLVGGGVEIAFSDSLSFRGQYLYGNELSGGTDQSQVSLGTVFNF